MRIFIVFAYYEYTKLFVIIIVRSRFRTNPDNVGQSWTPLAIRQNIAYLVATFGRDYSRNRLISMIYERKQNDPARRGAGKGRAAGLGQTAGESECR